MSGDCPFCGETASAAGRCGGCGRNPTAPRRVCPGCGRLSPVEEAVCIHCKRSFGSELSWKIPVIVFLFIAAFAAAVAIQLVR